MLLDRILADIGLPNKETQWKSPPKGDYLIYQDSVTRSGADEKNFISHHSPFLEFYSSSQDREAKEKIESVLDFYALEWERGETSWLQTEQLYMTAYYFDYYEKE